MDRVNIFSGATPRSADLAMAQQFAMISDGFLAEAFGGASAWAYGLSCSPTSPASMSVVLGRGCLGQMSVVDQTNPGSVAIADTVDALMKIGVNLQSVTTAAFVAPTTAGQSQADLIQAQLQETDTGSTTIPYYNSANPAAPFNGPNNTGAAQNLLRTQRVVFQVKSGIPAATGSQVPPAADAGWVPLYVVTVANGTTTLTSANISVASGAPFIQSIPQLEAEIAALQSEVGILSTLFQTNHVVTTSRAIGNAVGSPSNTVYTNTTGKPMRLNVICNTQGPYCILYLYVNGALEDNVSSNGQNVIDRVSGIIPPGATYQVVTNPGTGSSYWKLTLWNERY